MNRSGTKNKIVKLIQSDGRQYYSEIATRLQLGLKETVELCNELVEDGRLFFADEPDTAE